MESETAWEKVAEKFPEEIEEMNVHGLLNRALRRLSDCMSWDTVQEDVSFLNGEWRRFCPATKHHPNLYGRIV